MKKYIIPFILGSLFFATFAYSAPSIIYQRTIIPERDNAFDLGTSTQKWRNIYGTTLYGNGSNLTGVATLGSLSATSPLAYNSSTGNFYVLSGYEIPTTASTTVWEAKVSSQWTSTSTGIYYSSGNVGIGTVSPGAPLQVNSLTTSGVVNTLKLSGGGSETDGTGGNRILFAMSSGISDTYQQAYITGVRTAANFASALTFSTNNGSSASDVTEKVRITNGGNVGIGTTAPVEKLEVSGNIRLTSNGIVTTTSGYNVFSAATYSYLRAGSGYDIRIADDNNVNVLMAVGGGNVGIGTTSPGYKLEVNGTSSIGQLFLGAGTENQPSLVFGTATSTGIHLQAPGVIDVNAANQFRVDIGGNATIYDFQTSQFLPSPTNSVALGGTSNQWADMYLRSGATLNFNNGNMIVTHSTDTLAVATGTLEMTGGRLRLPLITNSILGTDGSGYVVSTSTLGGITSLGGQTGATQTFASSTATNFTFASAGDTHTFYFPLYLDGFNSTSTAYTKLGFSNSAMYHNATSSWATDYSLGDLAFRSSAEVPLTFSSGLSRTSNTVINSGVTSVAAGNNVNITSATGTPSISTHPRSTYFVIENPTSHEDDAIMTFDTTSTIYKIYTVNKTNTDTVTFNLCFDTNRNYSTSTCPYLAFTNYETTTATTTPSSTTSFATSTIPAGGVLRLLTSAASSTQFNMTIYWNEN